MQLKMENSFKSIKMLEPIDLPNFVLVTGPNGVGKSQLLVGTMSGQIVATDENGGTLRSKYFHHSSVRPSLGSGDAAPVHPSLELAGKRIIDAVKNRLSSDESLHKFWPSNVNEWQVDRLRRALGEENGKRMATIVREAEENIHANTNLYQALMMQSNGELGPPHPEGGIVGVLNDWVAARLTPTSELFSAQLAPLFRAYRDTVYQNMIERFLAGGSGYQSPDESETPWGKLNQAMVEAGFDLRITGPDTSSPAAYHPKIIQISSGEPIKLMELSSGEEIILALVFALFESDSNPDRFIVPQLLLLDEIDAPLHPQMIRRYIAFLTEILVAKHHARVIATTHSPSTVALAPEGSIYTLEKKDGSHRLKPVSKSQAIDILTAGVPTLAVDFEGRRQVFCESVKEAEIHSAFYEALKPYLKSERSLTFIGVGQATDSGCAEVKRIVDSLEGNISVFGLVDWDCGRNVAAGRIHVLSPTVRYAIETIAFDPMLLLAAFQRGAQSSFEKIGLMRNASVQTLHDLKSAQLQHHVDKIQTAVLGRELSGDTRPILYGRNVELNLRIDYLHMDAKELAAAVFSAFPDLKSYGKDRGAGSLMTKIAREATIDFPTFIPLDLADTYRRILDA